MNAVNAVNPINKEPKQSYPVKLKKGAQKVIGTVGSAMSNILSIGKILNIADKVFKLIEITADIDLSIVRAPIKFVKMLKTSAKLITKTNEFVGVDKKPFWKDEKVSNLTVARKVVTYVATIFKTVKFLGFLEIINLAKIGATLGKLPVFGVISQMPFGIVIKAIKFIGNILGLIEDSIDLHRWGKRKKDNHNRFEKWKQRNEDIKQILRQLRCEVVLNTPLESANNSLLPDLQIRPVQYILNESLGEDGENNEGYEAAQLPADFVIDLTRFDEQRIPQQQPIMVMHVGHVQPTILTLLGEKNEGRRNWENIGYHPQNDDSDEFNDEEIGGFKPHTKHRATRSKDVENIPVVENAPKIEEVIESISESDDAEEVDSATDLNTTEDKNLGDATIIETVEESNVEEELDEADMFAGPMSDIAPDEAKFAILRGDALQKAQEIVAHYQVKILSARINAGALKDSVALNKLQAKVIKWDHIIQSLESEDATAISSIQRSMDKKVTEKQHEKKVLIAVKKQKILSLIYRAAKVVIAVASIALFFSGVGTVVAIAIYVSFSIITLTFGMAKHFWQKHQNNQLNKNLAAAA